MTLIDSLTEFFFFKYHIMSSLYCLTCNHFSTQVYIQEKYEKAMASVAQMEKRAVMAESMLEATLQYESGQAKAVSSPRYIRNSWDIIAVFYVPFYEFDK